MNVNIVKRPLANLLGIRETILERLYECNECGKLSVIIHLFFNMRRLVGKKPWE